MGPPYNLTLLDQLEDRLRNSAETFIDEIVKKGFAIKSLQFEFTYSHALAQAMITGHNTYKIIFGRTLTSAILHLAISISPQLSKHITTCSESEVVEYAFNYISWMIFLHEVAHVTHGHLEYIQSNGCIGYNEVSNQRTLLSHLHTDQEESRHRWRALESEADAYAISASLVTLRYITPPLWWSSLKINEMLRHHGAMASAAFHLMHVLANEHDDFRHPSANIRLGISLASVEILAKKMDWQVNETVREVVTGHYTMASEILGLDMTIAPMVEAASYMFTLDDVIKRAGFDQFRLPTHLN